MMSVALGLVGAGSAGCAKTDDSTQVTVAFVSEAKAITSTSAPEIDEVDVTVSDGSGKTTYQQVFRASDGTLAPGFFPATLAVVPRDDQSLSQPFTVQVSAKKGGATVVERTAVTSFVQGRSLLLPMPLRMACAAQTCAAGQTCVGGACTSPAVSADTLSNYVESDVVPEAAGSQCFDEATCLSGSTALAIGADCTFTIPATVPSGKANVSIEWAAAPGRVIVLDGDDAAEGWTRNGSAQGKLSPGVCAAWLEQNAPDKAPSPAPKDKALGAYLSSKCTTKTKLEAFCRASPTTDVGVGAAL
jgi:hypothetical protein